MRVPSVGIDIDHFGVTGIAKIEMPDENAHEQANRREFEVGLGVGHRCILVLEDLATLYVDSIICQSIFKKRKM